jgi:hypothetical protein
MVPVEPDRSRDTPGAHGPDIAPRAGEPGKPGSGGRAAIHAVLALLGLAGVVVALLCTSRYGVGLSPDSANYLSAARSLLAEQGYRCHYGGPYTGWPPLFPTLLAAAGLAGVEPLLGARLLNSLAFGLIIFLSGQLLLRCTTSRLLVLAGTLSVLASRPLLGCCIMAWSEPVFIALTLLLLLCLPGFLRHQRLPALVLVAVLAGLACLERYIGVTLILAGTLLMALNTSGATRFRRLKYVVLFGVISATPLAVWCLRNRVLTGETVGTHRLHPASGLELVRTARPAARIVATWLAPWARADSAWPLIPELVVALAGVAIVWSRRPAAGRGPPPGQPTLDRQRSDISGLPLWSTAVFGLTYFGFLVVSAAGLGWRPEPRHMAPLYTPVMVLVIAGIEGAYHLVPASWARGRPARALGIVLCVLWLQSPFRAMLHGTRHHMRDGAGEYSTSAAQEAPLVMWLRCHPLRGKIYSNAPDAVYVFTGAVAAATPHHSWDAAAFARRELEPQPSYVVWFHTVPRDYLYDLRELLSRYRLEELAAFPDGAVYRYLGANGPGVSAVYRFWSPGLGRHFYTIQKAERDRWIRREDGAWVYEGPAFYAIAPDGAKPSDVRPVYRLWSAGLRTHFYTLDEAEKDRLLCRATGAWTCEGVAFYAWPQAGAAGALPVYRLWSQRLGCHFYTISAEEKTRLVDEFPDTWQAEGIAWYAYGPVPRPAPGSR